MGHGGHLGSFDCKQAKSWEMCAMEKKNGNKKTAWEKWIYWEKLPEEDRKQFVWWWFGSDSSRRVDACLWSALWLRRYLLLSEILTSSHRLNWFPDLTSETKLCQVRKASWSQVDLTVSDTKPRAKNSRSEGRVEQSTVHSWFSYNGSAAILSL